MEKKRRLVWVIFITLSMVLGACAPMLGAQESYDEAPAEAPSMDYDNEEAAEAEERGFDNGSTGSQAAVDRMVIYNADLRIAVEAPEDVMQSIIDMAENAGGFVVSSNLSKTTTTSGSLPRGRVTVRVPAGQLDSIMGAIKDLTRNPREDVLYENVSGQDVTAEYTDLRSRLRNLEAAEEALVALMEEAQDPQDVLDIFNELTRYRGEIEVVKGRMQYLEESAALSSISVEIIAKESLQPIEIAGWEPKGTAKRAIEALINTAQTIANGAIWFGIYCLPFLIPLGIGAYFLIRLIIKRRKSKKAGKTEVINKSEGA